MKGEHPKGFINIFDVVEVMRISDKKQCFQLLCPGVAHRLMASSESEADEWADCIRKQILFRREDVRFHRMFSQAGGTNSPLSSSPPNFLTTGLPHSHISMSQSTHPFFSPIATTTSSFSLYPPLDSTQTVITQKYPTPPESIITTAAAAGSFQKQSSLETPLPYPSPPSSDSSSMYSGSNTSFDNAPSVFDGEHEPFTSELSQMKL